MAITISGNGITSANIADGTITNADINASAAIDGSKISGDFGKVLQVLYDKQTGSQTIATTTYTDTNLSITITPSSTSSKILVMANVMAALNGGEGFGVNIVRGSTNILTTNQNYAVYAGSISGDKIREWLPISFLDSPSTTSATTYKIQVASYASNTIEIAEAGPLTMVVMEIGA